MKRTKVIAYIVVGLSWLSPIRAYAQLVEVSSKTLEAVKVYMSFETLDDREVVKVVKDSTIKEFNVPCFARLKDIEFKDGMIEVNVLSRLLPNAPETARGFIGIAFRINEDNSKYECIYIRPTNGRADDQVRRNHSVQYISHPDYHFDRLRRETPERYESYADMGLNEWITIKIVVNGSQAKLFLNDNLQPSLIVNDLKLGPDVSGGIGLWLDNGTEGYFWEIKVSQ